MSRKNLNTIPVYCRAIELSDLSKAIVSYVSQGKDMLSPYKSSSLRVSIADAILTDAVLIPKKIEQAENTDSYAVRIKSARFINVMTRNILSYCNGLERDGVKEKEYLNLLRGEIQKFRASYKEWKEGLSKR